MWSLKYVGSGADAGREQRLRAGAPVMMIGRGPGDEGSALQLSGDTSVSRRHAELRLEQEAGALLRDLGSRYGSWLLPLGRQPQRLEPQRDYRLQPGEKVRFGGLDNVWQLQLLQLRSCFSIHSCAKFGILHELEVLGVQIADKWSADCTHLTMPFIILTIKAVHALVHGVPIVSSKFWKKYHLNVNANLPPPSPEDYLPKIEEYSLNLQKSNFYPDATRRILFQGRKFVFLSRNQKEKFQSIIESASGESILLSERPMTKLELCDSKCAVMQLPTLHSTQYSQGKLTNIENFLSEKNLRLIPEAEIGMAILYKSLEKYCNTSFNFPANIIRSNRPAPRENVQVLALETQESETISAPPANVPSTSETIPASSESITLSPELVSSNSESYDFEPVTTRSRKTRRTSFEMEEPPHKIKPTDLRNPGESSRDHKSDEFTDSRPKIRLFDEEACPSPKRTKKYNEDRPDDDDDDLFNFIQPSAESLFPSGSKRNLSAAKVPSAAPKRIRLDDDEDFPDSRAYDKETRPSLNSKSSTDASFEDSRWISRREPSTLITIKKEAEAPTDQSAEILEREFKNIKLQPAVIIVNNNLIKKRKDPNEYCANFDMPKINYKKFVKIQPLKKPTEIISRNKLSVYESGSKNISRESHSDDEDDRESLFNMLDMRTTSSKSGRVRRL